MLKTEFIAVPFNQNIIKIIRYNKRQKTQFEETGQVSESDMAEMLELSDWKFKTIMINILRTLMDIADNKQEQMGDVNTAPLPKS